MIVNSLLVLRLGVNAADRSVELLGIGFLVVSSGMLWMGESRRRQLAKAHTEAGFRVIAVCAVCVVLVSLASMVAMLR